MRPPAAPVWLQPPLWRKQVDLPRILAALQGSPKRFSRRAARHLAVRPVAEPRASRHEVFALRFGLKPEDAAGPWVSRAKQSSHIAFSQRGTLPEHIMTPALVQLRTGLLGDDASRK